MQRLTSVTAVAMMLSARLLAGPELSPCEAYGAADAVFIGEAGPSIRRALPLSNGQIAVLRFSPVTVVQAFRGVSSSVVFITPAGAETYLVPGQRYLVYGRKYPAPDMFMSADSYGTKPLTNAANDLAFLAGTAANPYSATISGIVELDESDSAHIGSNVFPLTNITVRLSAAQRRAEAVTTAGGQFQVSGLAPGTYTADARLPDDLFLGDNPWRTIRVAAGGCAVLNLRAIPNGHIRGTLRTWDEPVVGQSVHLIAGELRPGGADGYFQSVQVDREGHFAFDGVRPGRYRLGRLSFNSRRNNREYRVPSVYYPGTLDREAATLIVVGRSGTEDVGEFSLPRLD